jgi:hypothetical protein
MKFVLQIAGVALMLAGGLWTLQGLGLVMWPAESFMLADRQWALNGALTFVAGGALFWLGSRRKR